MLIRNQKIMKTINFIIISLIAVFLTSCKGDKKSIIGADTSDDSFVNKNFDGNLINYDENMSACSNFSAADLAKHYDVPNGAIMIRDSTVDERLEAYNPTCKFTVMLGEGKGYLLGSISVYSEAQKDEHWEESWALRKAASRSAEWIKGVGRAALWKPGNRKLTIKFEGYSLVISVPGINRDSNKKNVRYKKIALDMAKSAGYIK